MNLRLREQVESERRDRRKEQSGAGAVEAVGRDRPESRRSLSTPEHATRRDEQVEPTAVEFLLDLVGKPRSSATPTGFDQSPEMLTVATSSVVTANPISRSVSDGYVYWTDTDL